MATLNMANPCLYIIGNGLDRFHDLPTSYSNFGNYIKAHDKEFYDNLSNWYPTFIDNQHKGVFSLWADFENGLKEIDQDLLWQYINDNLVQYGAEDWKDEDNHRVQYIIQNLVDCLTNRLKQHLVNWICLINVLATSKRLQLEADAIYFTFNYTKTLESYYKIPPKQVIHIHGTTDCPDSIITGHNMKIMQPVNDFDDIRLFECEKIIRNDYFQKTLKPVDSLIHKNIMFFNSLHYVSEIKIIGHSINDIDLPYYKIITQKIKKDAKWSIYFKDKDSMSKQYSVRKETLINLGVNDSCIIPFLMQDIEL